MVSMDINLQYLKEKLQYLKYTLNKKEQELEFILGQIDVIKEMINMLEEEEE